MTLEHICHLPLNKLFVQQGDLPPEQEEAFKAVVTRLAQGEPLQYILGVADFYGQVFVVNPSVMIPRPETEELVKLILSDHPEPEANILDLGTGSGCIAITLALELPEATVAAIDISSEALVVANSNAALYDTEISFLRADILSDDTFPKADEPFLDIIVSNPPYLTESEKNNMAEHVLQHEPHQALFVPDDDPLLYYRTLATIGQTTLKPGGRLYCEINPLHAHNTLELFNNYRSAYSLRDLSGKNRFIRATK